MKKERNLNATCETCPYFAASDFSGLGENMPDGVCVIRSIPYVETKFVQPGQTEESTLHTAGPVKTLDAFCGEHPEFFKEERSGFIPIPAKLPLQERKSG